MQPSNTLRFALSDRIDDAPVGPGSVPLAMLGHFQKDVAEFLAGSSRDVDPNQVIVSIQEGSLALVATGLLAAISLWADVERLHSPIALGMIDPRRAAVIERWQTAVRKHPHRSYKFADLSGRITVQVDNGTDFRNQIDAAWVGVDKYLHGHVTDMGGTNKATVHLRLENGKMVIVSSTQQLLADEERNRLYKPALVRVSAEENLRTGELRNLTLLGFEPEPTAWDEAEFDALVLKGSKAWANVSEEWLEELRAGQG